MNKVKNLSEILKNFFLNPRFLVSFFILFTFTIINATYVHADIDESTLDFYDANGIFYYDGKASNCVSSTPLDLSGNKLYNGDPVLTEGQLALIEKNKPVYEQSADKYNLPWQMFAVIHNMESSLNGTRNPSNHQGIYQFYEARNTNRYPPGPVTLEEFQKQTDELGQQIISNYGKGLDLTTDDGVKAMWFKYNGRAKIYVDQGRDLGFNDTQASQLGEGSPYVMNLADANRDSRNNKNWVECKKDGCKVFGPASIRAGTFIQYKALGGGGSFTTSGISCSGSSPIGASGNLISDTALKLAWPYEKHQEALAKHLTDDYKLALQQNGMTHVYGGASCDVFVASVMTYSGLDPEFDEKHGHCCGISGDGPPYQHIHQSKLYERVPVDINFLRDVKNYNDPIIQNGDILMYTSSSEFKYGHMAIFYREENGTAHLIHASKGDRTGWVGNVYGRPFEVWRYVGDKPVNTTENKTIKPDNRSTNNTVNTPTSQ